MPNKNRDIQRQNAYMRRIIRTAPIGISIVKDNIIRFANSEFETILGYIKGELLNQDFRRLFPDADSFRNILYLFEKSVNKEKNVSAEIRLLNKNGKLVDTYIGIAPLSRGKKQTGHILSILDISRQKQHERVNTEIHEIYRKSIENAHGVPYQLDFRTMTYTFIGKNLRNVLGISHEEMNAKYIRKNCMAQVIADPETHYTNPQEYGAAFLKGKIDCYRLDFQIKTPDGKVKWISDNAVPIRQQYSHKVIGALGILLDITERKIIEQEREQLLLQLRQQKKLESIGFLAAGVAHEINNPLTGMINYAELILKRCNNASLQEFAQSIIDEGSRIATIVRNLLAFAREDRENYKPTNINVIIQSSLSLINTILRKSHIRLILKVPSKLPLINCRVQQMQQVLINLLTNAVAALNQKYSGFDDDKIILVSVRSEENGNADILRLIVEDHGTGIDAENLDRIFDPFFTTKECGEGTGLGLSVSYGIIKDHDGTIKCESEVGKFTRFIIDLPVLDRNQFVSRKLM